MGAFSWLSSRVNSLEHFDVVLVIVGHPDLKFGGYIASGSVEGECTHSAPLVLNKLVRVFEVSSTFARGDEHVCRVIPIASNENVTATPVMLPTFRPHRVRETGRHIGYGHAERVLEVIRQRVSSPWFTLVEIFWDFVGIDGGQLVLLLVIVHKELLLAIAVQIDHCG